MKKRDTLVYKIITALFGLMILAGSITYFVNYDMVSDMFKSLGVPTSIIYPLAIIKILGVTALWFIKNPIIKKLAYLGFGIELTLAIFSHINAQDGGAFGPLIPLVLLIVSFIFYRKNNAIQTEQ
ncbi:MAG: DoxX family protein [Flavobacteriales bacterium]